MARIHVFAIIVSLLSLHNVQAGLLNSKLQARDDPNIPDFSWIKKWAAVGDSFSAGIGSGNSLYSTSDNSYKCSRYDHTYPVVMNTWFGPSVSKFVYTACSGAKTPEIFTQIDNLDAGQDLIVMTAGGNDLCLSEIIASCIASPAASAGKCKTAIDNAYKYQNDFFGNNIKDLLWKADTKVNDNGIIVLLGYAQYFDASTDECINEDWRLFPILSNPVPLTRDQRKTYNDLVIKTNGLLKASVDSVAGKSKHKIVFADWDPFAPLTGGQFCEPGSTGDPLDSANKNVMFFKFDTEVSTVDHSGELRRDLSFVSNQSDFPDPLRDGPRSVFPRQNPGDTPTKPPCATSWLSFPDGIGKIFHPNPKGHDVMASYALQAIASARNSQTACGIKESRKTCASSTSFRGYAAAEPLNQKVNDFCVYVGKNTKPSTSDWSVSQSYFTDTPDEYSMTFSYTRGSPDFSVGTCQSRISDVINGCDVPVNGKNPLNWKQGGKWVDSGNTYSVDIKRTNRPWPPPTNPTNKCYARYKTVYNEYVMRGGGYSSWDWGQKTLLPSARSCAGAVTEWKFSYFAAPDPDGNEWQAEFHDLVGTWNRCFKNGKVQKASGGGDGASCDNAGSFLLT